MRIFKNTSSTNHTYLGQADSQSQQGHQSNYKRSPHRGFLLHRETETVVDKVVIGVQLQVRVRTCTNRYRADKISKKNIKKNCLVRNFFFFFNVNPQHQDRWIEGQGCDKSTF